MISKNQNNTGNDPNIHTSKFFHVLAFIKKNFLACLIVVLTTLMLIFLVSCESEIDTESSARDPPETIGDLAYNRGGNGCVYLQESDRNEPYIVLTNDYNGNCLLLRKYLLDEARIYNVPSNTTSYYEGSDIDNFLSEKFILSYSDELRQNIAETEIEIAAEESIGHCGEETTTINRSVFLLSYTEVNGVSSRTILKEGSSLLYFEDVQNRIAYYENGEAGSWWLRSASTAGKTYACGVSADGVVGSAGIYNPNPDGGYYSGVRPAFCLSGNVTVSERNGEYLLADI